MRVQTPGQREKEDPPRATTAAVGFLQTVERIGVRSARPSGWLRFRGEDLAELSRADGLGEVKIEPGLPGPAQRLVVSVAAQREHPTVRGLRSGPEPRRDLVAVHPGETEVADDELGSEATRELECGGAVQGDLDLVAIESQDLRQPLGEIGLVVDQEDAASASRGRQG
jgi:hypothetical protein